MRTPATLPNRCHLPYGGAMSNRVAVAWDPDGPSAEQVRLWLLQLGADPFALGGPAASGLPVAPQHAEVTRDEVAHFVHRLRGADRSRADRFDDHGSSASWPRGSY